MVIAGFVSAKMLALTGALEMELRSEEGAAGAGAPSSAQQAHVKVASWHRCAAVGHGTLPAAVIARAPDSPPVNANVNVVATMHRRRRPIRARELQPPCQASCVGIPPASTPAGPSLSTVGEGSRLFSASAKDSAVPAASVKGDGINGAIMPSCRESVTSSAGATSIATTQLRSRASVRSPLNLSAMQAQRISNHRHRAETHRSRRDHRVEEQPEEWIEHAGGDRLLPCGRRDRDPCSCSADATTVAGLGPCEHDLVAEARHARIPTCAAGGETCNTHERALPA